MREQGDRLRGSLLSVLCALVIGGVIIALSGNSPFYSFYTVLQGSVGSLQNFMQMLAYTTPLIFTGLGAAVAFRAGVFNIGGEGQLYVGALTAALTGIYLDAPAPWPLIAGLLAGAIAGAIWALIPTALFGRSPTIIVVATIMMNPIGLLLAEYLVRYYFLSPAATTLETAYVGDGAVLPRFTPGSQLTPGIFIAIAVVVGVGYLMSNTTIGFSLRSIGKNRSAAEIAGIRPLKNMLIAMAISGALAGLGGAVVVLGVHRRFIGDFSPGYGWDGITVAILAGDTSLGVVLAAALFGMLRSATISMNFAGAVPVDLIVVLQGVIVCFVAAPLLWKMLGEAIAIPRRRDNKERGRVADD